MKTNRINSLKQPTYKAGLLQSRAYRKLTVFMTSNLKKHDLSLPEWSFLGLVHETNGMKLQELASILDVEPPFATRLSNTLQKKGHIRKVNDSSDARAKLVMLTDQGSRLVETVEKVLRVEMKRYLAGIHPLELATYVYVLEKISRLP